MMTDKAVWFFENFRGVAGNSLFSVYDPVLRDAVDKLYGGWLQALAHVDEYNTTPSGKSHVFSSPGDMPLTGNREKAWKDIDAGRHEMAAGLTGILDRLRADYIEISILRANELAWKGYIDFHKEIEAKWEAKPKRIKKKAKK